MLVVIIRYLANVSRRPRAAGSLVGLAIATALVLSQPLDATAAAAISQLFGIGALAAGTLGGFVFGPMAARASGDGSTWLGIIFGLAGFAVVVGAFVVTSPVALQASASATAPADLIIEAALRWVAVALIGAFILGLPTLLVTLPAAAVWAAIMAILIDQGRRAAVAGSPIE